MRWIWDEVKADTNRRKHNVSFETAVLVFRDPKAVSVPDPHRDGNRWRTIGEVGTMTTTVLFVVHTEPAEDGTVSTPDGSFRPVGRLRGKEGDMRERSRLTPQQKAEIEALASMPDEAIDTSDMPEITDWAGVERGRFYRPLKKSLTLRVDADVVEWFKCHGGHGGKGYQTRMNAALREYVIKHSDPRPTFPK